MGRKPKLTLEQTRALGKKLDRKATSLRKKYPRDVRRQAMEFTVYFEKQEKLAVKMARKEKRR